MSTATIDPTTTYNLDLVKEIYTTGKLQDVPELAIAIAVAILKENFAFLQNFNPFDLIPLMGAVAGYQQGMRDCPCGELDCPAHAMFLAFARADTEKWEPAAEYGVS